MATGLLSLLALPSLASAYSWKFVEAPKQCSNLSITISGNDGKPPYRVLIVPFGSTPLPNNVEARKILEVPFNGSDSNTVSFKLNYPANSQLVAVVSDSSGFASGGTSVAAQVTTSSDSSCFDASKSVDRAPFVFSVEPPNQLVQCQSTRLWWDKTLVQGNPTFLGVIPGGESFVVPEGSITDVQAQGTGFSWTPAIRGGTTVLVVGGDNRGNGTGGSFLATVSNGPDNIGTCLNSNSPSSTPGTPAGGAYQTGVDGSGTGGGSNGGGGTNVGAIVGGVIGGVVALIAIGLLCLFFWRRKRVHRERKERPMDLEDDDDDDERGAADGRTHHLPDGYQPEPFTVPDPTIASTYLDDGLTSEGRPLSGYSGTERSGTPDLIHGGAPTATSSASGRKGPLRQMRPVNIIQHDDAGPSEAPPPADDVETVELPPAYTNIRR